MAQNENIGLLPFQMAAEMRNNSDHKRHKGGKAYDKTTETIILMQIAYYTSIAKYNDEYQYARLKKEKLKELFPNYNIATIYRAIDYLLNEQYLKRIKRGNKKCQGDYCLTEKAGRLIKKYYWHDRFDNIQFYNVTNHNYALGSEL